MLYRTVLPVLVWLNFASVLLPVTATAQTANNSASTPADGVAERYMMLLRRSPRYGTAFDRVVEFEQVCGTLPSLISNLQLEFDATNDGNLALLIGMLQSRRSDDTAAISALQKAEVLLPEQPLASFYLGKSLASNMQWDAAIGAMRRALDKKSNRQDLLTISMELGRLFHNARRGDEALQTWEQLAKDFPGDVQILRQIAVMQADSGQWEPALQTYAQLAASSRDPFQQVEYAIRVAELKVKLGKQMEALAEFESLLPKVDPESWLHELIRNQIDGIYLESADYVQLDDVCRDRRHGFQYSDSCSVYDVPDARVGKRECARIGGEAAEEEPKRQRLECTYGSGRTWGELVEPQELQG